MKIHWDKIIEGWRNNLIPPIHLKDLINQVSNERIEICKECEFNSLNQKGIHLGNHCTICGCPLSALTKCLSCDCSFEHPKWKAVISGNEEIEISNGKDKDDIEENSSGSIN